VGTFETIPVDLEEAAAVDGCHRVGVLTRVVLPLAAPGVAVAALFAWLESWNEFTYALYLSLTENTLPLQVYYYVTRGNWFDAATYATLLTVPVIIVTAWLQRYLKAGLLAGAIKS
jgi:trehalose transport system permease protein